MESVIADKNKQIDQLEAKIKELENQIKDYVKYEAGEKIVISKDGLPVFIDLIDLSAKVTIDLVFPFVLVKNVVNNHEAGYGFMVIKWVAF